MEIILKMSDIHVPYHDEKALNVTLKLAKHIQPKILILDEVVDFYSISKYNKDPNRKMALQDDLDLAHEIRTKIRKTLPKTKIIELESNHNKRLEKYLNSRAEELKNLRCLKIEKLMRLSELDISYKEDFIFRDVLFKHGDKIRPDSSYTAKAEFLQEGMSGASGHTHRLGMHFKTQRGGKYVWLEGGCLCQTTDIEFIEGTANWQQGVCMFMFKNNSKYFQPKVVPIIDYEILWGKSVFVA